jgi:hypothetical protein
MKKTSNVSINIKMRSVRVTIVVVEQQEVIHIMGVYLQPSYSVCNAHAPYLIVICGLSGSMVFFHIIS